MKKWGKNAKGDQKNKINYNKIYKEQLILLQFKNYLTKKQEKGFWFTKLTSSITS